MSSQANLPDQETGEEESFLPGSEYDEYSGSEDEPKLAGDGGGPEEPPMTSREREDAIERLVASMKDCSDIPKGLDAQAVKRIRDINFYPEEAYRRVATENVESAINSQLRPLVPEYQKYPHKVYSSVAERLNALNNTYRKSKAAVKQALDPRYADKLVDNPERELKSKQSNLVLNRRRNMEVKVGKKELAKQMHGDSDSEDEGPRKKSKSSPTRPPVTPSKRKTTSSKRQTNPSQGQRRSARNKTNLSVQDAHSQSPSCESSVERDSSSDRPIGPPALYMPEPPSASQDLILQEHYQHVATGELEQCLGIRHSVGMLAELQRRYRLIICDLLGIPMELASPLTLGELRGYARAYYHPYQNFSWRIRGMPAQWPSAIEDVAVNVDGRSIVPLAIAMPIFREIALFRGDILPNGTRAERPNYLRDTTQLEDRAIGVASNPVGTPWGFLPPPTFGSQD